MASDQQQTEHRDRLDVDYEHAKGNPFRLMFFITRELWRYWRIGHDYDGRCSDCGCLEGFGCGHDCTTVEGHAVHPTDPDEHDVHGWEGVVR